ncbi:hypothetical protein IOD13_00485 [Brevibacterium casei]|nr:hypothetical protein [Brevibacterium casei]
MTVGPIVTALTALTVIAGVAALTRSRWARWLTGRLLGAVVGIELFALGRRSLRTPQAPGAPGVSWGSWPEFLAYVGVPAAVGAESARRRRRGDRDGRRGGTRHPAHRRSAVALGRQTRGRPAPLLPHRDAPTVGFAEVVRYGVVLQIGAVLIVSARGSWPRRDHRAEADASQRRPIDRSRAG